ncbi:hypothetical protein SprV_0301164400 [Sparganum proliferum]
MLMDAYRDERPGMRVAYRTDGQLFNQQWMHFQSRESATSVHELLFADDCALNAASEGDTHGSMDLFAAACDDFGLIVKMEQTVIMHQLPPAVAYVASQINVNGAQMQTVDNVTYLAAPTLATPKSTMKWLARFPRPTKPSVVCETPFGIDTVCISTPNSGFTRQSSCRRCCMERDLDSAQEAGRKTQRFPPQLSPMDTEAEVAGPDPGHGRSVLRYKDPLKTSLQCLQIDPVNWEELTRDRSTWRRVVKTGAAIHEANRITAAKAKREVRKSQLSPTRNANNQPSLTCPRCKPDVPGTNRSYWTSSY